MAELTRRVLGRTGVEVTTLGFGAMELRGEAASGPAITDGQAEAVLNTVLDEGINMIDTSIDYGRSEELIGKYIAHRRSEYFLATKCGCVPGSQMGRDHVHTAANIRTGVENSLRLLQTDVIDLVQFHRSLSQAELQDEGGLDELIKLRDEGKVRFLGVSANLPTLDEQIGMGIFDAFQIPYSAVQQDQRPGIERASAAGAGIIVRGGVARGVPEDWASRRYYMVATDTMRDRWETAGLEALLDGMDRIAFMLRYTLSLPELDTTIVGTANVDHLRTNLAVAAMGALPADVVAEVDRRLADSAAG